MLPISAYWTRCSGLASALAPTSRRKQFFPPAVGMMEPIAGRSMPAIRCRPKSAAAITAPLFPALTKPLTRPSSTIVHARTLDEFLLARPACAGFSCIAITSGASSICAHFPAPDAARAASTLSLTPTKITSTPSSRCACTPPATTWSGAKSPPIASSAIFIGTRGWERLDVQVAHGLGVRLNESLAGIDIVAHQDVEDLVRLDRIFDLDTEQHAVLWVHGGFPELLGVHLTETLVASDLGLSGHLRELPILLLIGVGVADLFASSDLVERWLRDVEISTRDHLRHVPEEKCEQQCTNVRAIYVSIGHDYHMMISEFPDIKFLANTSTEGGDEVADLLGGEDLVLAGLLDVQDLSAQRKDRLEATVAGALRRATSGIALDEVDLAEARVAL